MTFPIAIIEDKNSGTRDISLVPPPRLSARAELQAPPVVVDAGLPAQTAWDDFFRATLRNRHTRAAYGHALRLFFKWLEPRRLPIERVTPGLIGRYFDEHGGAIPTRKLHLAALRAFFDLLVTRHIAILNPAASVRAERYAVVEGKTPEITVEDARRLLTAIRIQRKDQKDETIPLRVGLRDRALIAVLIYTAARAGAVSRLRVRHFTHDGTQWTLRFEEKGGKSREIPVRHDLQQFILSYMQAAGITSEDRDLPLFRSAARRTDRLTSAELSGIDIYRMVKRRLKEAGLPSRLSPHSFRVTTITDLLTQGVPLEDVQYLAGHADPRTTRLYDRRQKSVTRNVVERISI